MSDFTALGQALSRYMPDIHRDMAPGEWAAFKDRLGALLPALKQAYEDDDARLEAYFDLKRLLQAFPQTRRLVEQLGEHPGALLVDAEDSLARDEPAEGLTNAEVFQRMLADLIEVAEKPDAAAQRPAPPDRSAPSKESTG